MSGPETDTAGADGATALDPPARISVVMVSYATGPALMEAIRAVQRDPDVTELIVVDNGNSAADRHRLLETASRRGEVRVLQGHGNIGFARACNYGASLASGDYLHFVNPDALVERGASRALVGAIRAAGTAPCVAGGMLVNVDGLE
ncbi:MAG: glycosyltransferase, partial [Litorimonas sp.]